jgi:DNA (cytosine-5)-methyltransferase 1
MGLHRAGFEVVGFDIEPQPRYPFEFHQEDALDVDLSGFDAVWASPPCQAYSVITRDKASHPDLYAPTRQLLIESQKPYIIENVIGAPYDSGIILCGSMFDMCVRRHRNFETSWMMFRAQCRHQEQGRPITITGHGGGKPSRHSDRGVRSEWPVVMGMPWATPKECTQAIPPAYSEHLGHKLITVLA